jgi:DNA-binding NtrC family response regulator
MLPGMSGMDLLKEIKRIDPTISVVIVTGSENDRLGAEAVENGAAAFVRKPFDLTYLDRFVRDLMPTP